MNPGRDITKKVLITKTVYIHNSKSTISESGVGAVVSYDHEPRDRMETPFDQSSQLNGDLDSADGSSNISADRVLPGYPSVSLSPATNEGLTTYLKTDLLTPRLDRMASWFGWITTVSASNILPLSEQGITGRKPILTENPELHLVWRRGQIFIKPLPKYLLSHKMWQNILIDGQSPLAHDRELICKAALGYLRTWPYLIQHESDFEIAKHRKLIPQHLEWQGFSKWTAAITEHTMGELPEKQVSKRYRAGTLRLTRLNRIALFTIGCWNFQYVPAEYADHFAQQYGLLISLFAIISITLSAFQLSLAVDQAVLRVPRMEVSYWLWGPARAISAGVLGLLSLLIVVIILDFLVLATSEIQYALKRWVNQREWPAKSKQWILRQRENIRSKVWGSSQF